MFYFLPQDPQPDLALWILWIIPVFKGVFGVVLGIDAIFAEYVKDAIWDGVGFPLDKDIFIVAGIYYL